MAKRKEELLCLLPFTAKKGASYGFIVRGNLVVLENGVPKHKTSIPADPDSNYRVEGKKLIRSFVPGAREKITAKRDQRSRIMKSPDFLAVVAEVAKAAKSRARKVTFETGALDDELEGYVVAGRKVAVEEIIPRALARNALVFRTRFSGELDELIGVVPGDDPIDLCELLVNVANVDVEPDDVKKVLRSLKKSVPFTLTAVAPDFVEAKLARVPKDVGKVARAIESLNADEIDASAASKMLRQKELHLWWD